MFGRQPPTGYAGPHWGARTIYDVRAGTIDLLHDRQQADGDDAARKALARWLNGPKGALAAMRNLVKAERPDYAGAQVLVVERDGYRLEACAQRSYGYLYLGAWAVAP